MTFYPCSRAITPKFDVVDAKLYQLMLRPFGEATSLSASCYSSKSFADLEDEKIWTQLWVCAGFEQQIPNSGDLLPVTIGNHGTHIQRQKNGSLQAAFNSAQHGGCRSIPMQCQTGKKTNCFYTSCGYSHDRNVIYADENGEEPPEMRQFVGFNPAKLLPVKLEVWAGFIFLSLKVPSEVIQVAASSNLNRYSSPLWKTLEQFPGCPDFANRKFKPIGRVDYETGCNWKLAGKSLINTNLVPQQSASSINSYSISHYSVFNVDWNLEFTGLTEINRHFASLSERLKAELFTAKQCYWLFPNLLFIPAASHIVSIIIQPTSLTGIIEHLDVFVDEKAEKLSDYEEKQLLNFWKQVGQRRSQSLAAAQAQVQFPCRQMNDSTFDCEKIEVSLHSYTFQKFLIHQILKE